MSLCLTGLMPHPPLLIPEVGGENVARVEKTVEGMRALARSVMESSPDVILLITPHGRLYRDAFGIYGRPRFEGDFGNFGLPEIAYQAEGLPELAEAIANACLASGLPSVFSDEKASIPLDHGIMVPLHFLREAGYRGKLLPLTYSLLDRGAHYRFGQILGKVLADFEGLRSAFIASGDLSHRLIPGAPAGYTPRGREFDERIMALLGENRPEGIIQMEELLLDEAGECGFRSILVMLGTMASSDFEAHPLSYEGPFGVGYGTIFFQPKES